MAAVDCRFHEIWSGACNSIAVKGDLGGLESHYATKLILGGLLRGGAEVASEQQRKKRGGEREGLALAKGI